MENLSTAVLSLCSLTVAFGAALLFFPHSRFQKPVVRLMSGLIILSLLTIAREALHDGIPLYTPAEKDVSRAALSDTVVSQIQVAARRTVKHLTETRYPSSFSNMSVDPQTDISESGIIYLKRIVISVGNASVAQKEDLRRYLTEQTGVEVEVKGMGA